MEEFAVDEVYVDITTEEKVDNVVDEASWTPSHSNFSSMIGKDLLSGGVILHAGVSSITEAATKKRIEQNLKASSRRAAALLLRMVSILTLSATSGLPFLFICSWRPGEDASALELKALSNRRFGLPSKKHRVQ